VAEIYERYAEWVDGGMGEVAEGRDWSTLEDGVELIKEFDEIYKRLDGA
jgi:hypothetical protein